MIAGILQCDMRYSPEHKAEVHEKIVKDAARRVRAEGMTGAGVATVMKDAGLTHGGFYKHFGSKDELLAESLRQAFEEIAARLTEAARHAKPGTAWKAMVKEYLSVEHCEQVDRGCPLAALAPELARADTELKPKIARELLRYRDRMVPYMPGRQTAEKVRNFLVIISTMLGAVSLARILPEREMRERVLGTVREFLLGSF